MCFHVMTMQIGQRTLRLEDPPYLIAEVGVAHGGSLHRAIELVGSAAAAGADAVKFQAYKAEKIAHPNSPTYFQQSGDIAPTQFQFFKRYDRFGPAEYRAIARACQATGVDFLCTPFDMECVEWLDELVPAWKIASADITNYPLLEQVGATGKPILLSTGAATLDEILAALGGLAEVPVALLHCVLAYPTPREDANLLVIQSLRETFPGTVVGYSDHTPASPEMETCFFAYLLGARVIEKHFTWDKTLPGNDHYHSMDAQDLRVLRQRCDEARPLLGYPEKRVLAVEHAARQYARRGLYAARALSAGSALQVDDIAILRPQVGLGPEDYALVLGCQVKRDVAEGEAITAAMLAA